MEKQQNDLAKFDKLKAEVELFVKPTFEIAVKDQESCDSALEVGRDVKKFLKKVEDRRKELVKPLNDEVKRINDYAKRITEPLQKSERHIKGQLASYERILEQQRMEEMKKAEEERRRLEAEAKAKLEAQKRDAELEALFKTKDEIERDTIVQEAEAERVDIELKQAHANNVKSIHANKVAGARKVWKCSIVDIQDLPIEFLQPNETAIMKAFHAGVKEIPGVEFYEETNIAIR